MGIALDVLAVEGGERAKLAAAIATRGLVGGTREEEDAVALTAALSLMRACMEHDALAADEAWADEPLGAVLCACVESVGTTRCAVERKGGTRSVFSMREERIEGPRPGGGVGIGPGALVGA